MVLREGGSTNLQYEPPSNISYLAVPNLKTSEMCLNPEPNLQTHTNVKVDKVNNFAPCIFDIDIEKGKAEIATLTGESMANLKPDDSLAVCLFILVYIVHDFFKVLEMLVDRSCFIFSLM